MINPNDICDMEEYNTFLDSFRKLEKENKTNNPVNSPCCHWQPIETAPRDGTEILVYFEFASVPIVHIAWYRSKEEWETSGQYCGGWSSLEEWKGWWSYTENSISKKKLEGHTAPSYWMPFTPVENAA